LNVSLNIKTEKRSKQDMYRLKTYSSCNEHIICTMSHFWENFHETLCWKFSLLYMWNYFN